MKKIIHLGIDWEDFGLVFFDQGKIRDYKYFLNDFYKENEYLLDFLKKESIKAIFFCNARTAEVYPDLLKKVVSSGHQIAPKSGVLNGGQNVSSGGIMNHGYTRDNR